MQIGVYENLLAPFMGIGLAVFGHRAKFGVKDRQHVYFKGHMTIVCEGLG